VLLLQYYTNILFRDFFVIVEDDTDLQSGWELQEVGDINAGIAKISHFVDVILNRDQNLQVRNSRSFKDTKFFYLGDLLPIRPVGIHLVGKGKISIRSI